MIPTHFQKNSSTHDLVRSYMVAWQLEALDLFLFQKSGVEDKEKKSVSIVESTELDAQKIESDVVAFGDSALYNEKRTKCLKDGFM